ncbi:hypothetical protein CTI12_AA496640 [Artemisia annua]|uniref:Uncharacterized protein n=1 Tax=Artemisia annua TaxID=35608 RepID=A0A2U1LFG3_ARTAN|nr:hypothetical protein CTI12_AA496640 [Artemisia annua]
MWAVVYDDIEFADEGEEKLDEDDELEAGDISSILLDKKHHLRCLCSYSDFRGFSRVHGRLSGYHTSCSPEKPLHVAKGMAPSSFS